MSNSLFRTLVSRTSSVGKSSILITRSAHSARNVSGKRRNASIANTSNCSSVGAEAPRQASGSWVSFMAARLSCEGGDIEIDRQRHETGKAQAPPDAPPPQLDLVDRSVRTDRIVHGVARGEMVGCAPRRPGERRGRESVAVAQTVERAQRLAPLLLLALPWIAHAGNISLRTGPFHRQAVDAAAVMRERNRQTAGTFMRGMVFAVLIGTLAVAGGDAAAKPAT